MSEPAAYSLRDVRRSYGPQFTLTVDRLAIDAGETLCLLGPTGAGKSTLLRLLAGLERPDAGSVQLGDHELGGVDAPLPVRRRIAVVPQRPVLLTGSVQWNVEYGLRLRGIRDAASRASSFMERLGLGSLARQWAATLSGGQAQLVALARALVVEPDVLLLDEPTAHLDPARVARVESVVSDARAGRGPTVVWATHNLFQARRVAHRVALLLDGGLVEIAPVARFFESPVDRRAKDFVEGRMIY